MIAQFIANKKDFFKVSPIAWLICLYFFLLLYPFKLNVSVIILAIAGILASIQKIDLNRRKAGTITLLVLLYVFITILSILFSTDISRSIKTSLPLEPSLLIFFLVSYYYQRVKDIQATFIAILLVSTIILIMLLSKALINLDKTPLEWVNALSIPIIAVPNDISFCCLAVPLLFSMERIENKRIIRFLATGYLSLAVSTAVLYRSAVGITCIAASLICFLILENRITSALRYLVLVLIGTAIIDWFMGFPLATKISQTLHLGGWDPRVALWLAALSMFIKAPVLGFGPHTFVLHYRSLIDQMNLPSSLPLDNRVVPWAHNLYFEMLAERGIFGFLALLALMAAGLYVSYITIKKNDADYRMISVGTFSVLFGFCVGSMIEFTFLRIWVIVLFFTLLGVINKLYIGTHTKKKEGKNENIS